MHILFDLTIPQLKIYPPDQLAQILKPVHIQTFPEALTVVTPN